MHSQIQGSSEDNASLEVLLRLHELVAEVVVSDDFGGLYEL